MPEKEERRGLFGRRRIKIPEREVVITRELERRTAPPPPSVDWEEVQRLRREQEHQEALPTAEAIDSFIASLQAEPSFFTVLDEKYPDGAPHSTEQMPESFDIATGHDEEGNAFGIHFDRRYGKKLKVSKVVLAGMGTNTSSHNMTLAIATLSVSESDGLYSNPFAMHHAFPNIGHLEHGTPLAFEKAKALMGEIVGAPAEAPK